MRDKQIEEMAKIICLPTANKGNCEKCGFKKHCSKFDDATDLYNAGYRKASEIFEEIEKALDNSVETEHFKGTWFNFSKFKQRLAELKKKYESEGEG